MLMTEEALNVTVQEMCKNGAFIGAAELIETWVFSEQEHIAMLEEAKTLANYEDVLITEAEGLELIAREEEETYWVGDTAKQGETAEQIVKKQPKSIKERMSDEFGSSDWS